MAPEIRYDGVHCAFLIERPADSILVLRISGTDVGELGDAPMRGLDDCLAGPSPFQFFIDARETRGASIEVSGEWAVWLKSPQAAVQPHPHARRRTGSTAVRR